MSGILVVNMHPPRKAEHKTMVSPIQVVDEVPEAWKINFDSLVLQVKNDKRSDDSSDEREESSQSSTTDKKKRGRGRPRKFDLGITKTITKETKRKERKINKIDEY